MFKLGEYDGDEASWIVQQLKKAGIKADIRPSFVPIREEYEALEGRASQLRGLVEDFDQYERYLEALREALQQGLSGEEFRNAYLGRIIPSWPEMKTALSDLAKDEGDEDTNLDETRREELQDAFIEATYSLEFAQAVMDMNGIHMGDPGQSMDDPILLIRADLSRFETPPEQARHLHSFCMQKVFDIFVDEFSTTVSDTMAPEFMERYPDEYLSLRLLGMLLMDLMDREAPLRMDMEEFESLCQLEIKNGQDVISIDASGMAAEIARILEKNDIIKLKGDKIKWR